MCEECEKAHISFIWHTDMAPNETPNNIINAYHPEAGMIQTLGNNLLVLKESAKDEINAYLAKIFADENNFRRK